MLSEKMQKSINEQIGYEFYSAFLYLAMSAHFETMNLKGFAAWMRERFAEEQTHAMKFFDYVNDRGSKVELPAIAQPPVTWTSHLNVFQDALDHERGVTRRIHDMYAMAAAENDYATQAMLQWFITEQVEEEKMVAEVIEHLKLIDARGTAVLMLDHRLGKAKS